MALLVCFVFFLVLVTAITAFGYFQYAKPVRMLRQLEAFSSGLPDADSSGKKRTRTSLLELLAKMGALMPLSPQETAMRKKELSAAGFRADSAVYVFGGTKVVGAGALLSAGFFLRDCAPNPTLHSLLPFFFGVVGFLLPGLVLARLTTRRQEQIRYALADALDMLVVCSEAGCALDQAILNVSREFRLVHPALSEEFSLVNMEILAGSSRAAALRNFAVRTAEEEVKKLVAILVQTDKFGTSIADALRTQADFMRVKRQQAAEERAGKVGVKLIFPIFFFCMPALVVVVMGPALLQLTKNFLPSINGTP